MVAWVALLPAAAKVAGYVGLAVASAWATTQPSPLLGTDVSGRPQSLISRSGAEFTRGYIGTMAEEYYQGQVRTAERMKQLEWDLSQRYSPLYAQQEATEKANSAKQSAENYYKYSGIYHRADVEGVLKKELASNIAYRISRGYEIPEGAYELLNKF